MVRFLQACAAAALLAGCSEPEADKAAPAAAGSATSASADAYRPFFETRWPAGTPIAPAEVQTMIEARGATATVQTLAGDGTPPNRWGFVTRSMASGDPAWLVLAPVLGPGTENATAYELQAALQDALTRNPADVLPLLERMEVIGGVGGICVEGGLETPPDQTRAFYADAIAAVEAVVDPAMRTAKASCLASLRAGAAAP